MKNRSLALLLVLVLTGCAKKPQAPAPFGGSGQDKAPEFDLGTTDEGRPAYSIKMPKALRDLKAKFSASLSKHQSTSNHTRGVLSLDFNTLDITDADLDEIIAGINKANVPVFLSIIRCKKITKEGLKKLAEAKNLYGLTLWGFDFELENQDVGFLENLTELRWIEIKSDKIDQGAYQYIAKLDKTERCELGPPFFLLGDECLKHMANMKRLDRLNIGSERLTDKGLEYLKNFYELDQLSIRHAKLSPQGLKNIKKLGSVYNLTIATCTGTTGDALSGLKSLPSLKSLNLRWCDTDDQSLSHIAGLHQIDSIDLVGSNITDAGLNPLGDLAGLKFLNVAECKGVDGSGFASLAKRAQLEGFGFEECPLTDDAIAHIEKLTKLESMDFTLTNVSYPALVQLKKRRPGVKIIDYVGMEVTANGWKFPLNAVKVDDIRDKAPDLSITFDSLYEEFKKDRSATQKKYQGKILELSSTIKEFHFDSGNTYDPAKGASLILSPGGNADIECFTANQTPWIDFSQGQRVTIKGVGSIGDYRPTLKDCVIIEADKSKPTRVSAQQLLEQFTKEKETFVEANQGKTFILTGTLGKRALVGVPMILEFKTKGDVIVQCNVYDYNRGWCPHATLGKPVTIKCKLDFYKKDEAILRFQNGFPIP